MQGERAFGVRSERPHGRPLPVHVVLLPTVPVLVLWAGNAADVRNMVPVLLVAVLASLSLVLTAIVTVVQRDLRRGAVMVSAILVLGGVFGRLLPSGGGPGAGALVFVALGLVGLGVVCVRAPSAAMRRVTILLNVVAIALMAANAVQIAMTAPASVSTPSSRVLLATPTADRALPDVWYIAPDRLPDLDVLTDAGVDTSVLAHALRSRGFVLTESAWGNYPSTQTSLASAWGARQLDVHGATSLSDQAAALLDDPPIGRMFRQAGYEYLHLGTWLDDTATSASAHEVLTLRGPGEFYDAFERGSIIPTLCRIFDIGVPGFASIEHRQIEHAQHQFRVLGQLASEPRSAAPRFVLSHMTLPHPPYVFRADGSTRLDEVPPEMRRAAYQQQLDYFTNELMGVVDRLLERPEPPVILLMADEGVYPEDLAPIDRPPLNTASLSDDQLRQKMSITAAVRAPEGTFPAASFEGASSPLDVVSLLLSRVLGQAVPIDDPGHYYPAPPGHTPAVVEVSNRLMTDADPTSTGDSGPGS